MKALAKAVLVMNPALVSLYEPHCQRVEAVPWGMDLERFPVSETEQSTEVRTTSFLFAGLTSEVIKGFHVLREACSQLWEHRQDFELVVTDEAPQNPEPYVSYIGWQTQDDLPRVYQETEITVVPTIAQDGLSRTSGEAMGSARPVVASRIGGLPFTVRDGETGFLFEPGNPTDLAEKLSMLLDDAPLRQQMGQRGRTVFEKEFAWPGVIQRHYIPLLGEPALSQATGSKRSSSRGTPCTA